MIWKLQYSWHGIWPYAISKVPCQIIFTTLYVGRPSSATCKGLKSTIRSTWNPNLVGFLRRLFVHYYECDSRSWEARSRVLKSWSVRFRSPSTHRNWNVGMVSSCDWYLKRPSSCCWGFCSQKSHICISLQISNNEWNLYRWVREPNVR